MLTFDVLLENLKLLFVLPIFFNYFIQHYLKLFLIVGSSRFFHSYTYLPLGKKTAIYKSIFLCLFLSFMGSTEDTCGDSQELLFLISNLL